MADYPTVRCGPPSEGCVVDILSRLGDALRYEDLKFQTVEVEGVSSGWPRPSPSAAGSATPFGPSAGRTQPCSRRSSTWRRTDVPVHRFRDPEEARQALWLDSDDPALPRRIRARWEFFRRLALPARKPGISKCRVVGDANADREEWIRRRVAPLRGERGGSKGESCRE